MSGPITKEWLTRGFKRKERLRPGQHSRRYLEKVGRLGQAQREWNAKRMDLWRKVLVDKLKCAVTGEPDIQIGENRLQVGHILSRNEAPHLRMTVGNVAPITEQVNQKMCPGQPGYTPEYEAFAQERMRVWVRRHPELQREED